MTGQTVLILCIVAIAAGALAARFLKTQPWKGAVEIVAGLVVGFLVAVFFASFNPILVLVAQMLGAGIAGGVMKLKGNQIAGIFVASFLSQALVFLLVGAVQS